MQAWSQGYCRDDIGVVFPVRATVLFRPADGEAVTGAIVRGALLPSDMAGPTCLPNSQAPASAFTEQWSRSCPCFRFIPAVAAVAAICRCRGRSIAVPLLSLKRSFP